MPEFIVPILTAYIVTADDERAAGEAAYDITTGAGPCNAENKRGEQITFSDGRLIRAVNAELAAPVEEVDEKPDLELIKEVLGGVYEEWTIKQDGQVWWVRDQDGLPVVSDTDRTQAIALAEAIGEDQKRAFKIVQEKD